MVGEEEWLLEEGAEGAAVTIKKTKSVRSISDAIVNGFKEIIYRFANRILSGEDVFSIVLNVFKKMRKVFVSSDIVLCIFCEEWPACAREWSTRERRWPNINLVESITQGGFHIVPKSSPDGNFRLSFSHAEAMLMKSLTPFQHRVIRAFKAIVKYHQDSWSPDIKEILSSYHLKTVYRILAF